MSGLQVLAVAIVGAAVWTLLFDLIGEIDRSRERRKRGD